MPNMSYCRFENTYRDLVDCYENINDDLSKSEHNYRNQLLDLCREILNDYEGNEMEWQDENEDDNSNFRTYNEAPYGQDNEDEVSWDMQSR